MRIFLRGRNRAIAVRGDENFHLHGDFEDDRRAHTHRERIVRSVERALGRHRAGDGFHGEGNDGRSRNKQQNVFVHRHRRSGFSLRPVGVGVEHLYGNGHGRLDARAMLVGLPVNDEIGNGRLGRKRTRTDERERICRIFGHEIGEDERIIFQLRLLDAGVELALCLNADLFVQPAERVAADGTGAFIRLEI